MQTQHPLSNPLRPGHRAQPAAPEENSTTARTALITCGALVREVLELKSKHGWDVDVLALPALLHNHPGRIPAAVQERIQAARQQYERIAVVYGDCGTGGLLDRLLETEDIERIPGPHCFEVYGGNLFEELTVQDPGTFFLTDFLVSQFDSLVIRELGLDRYPELRDDYFGNYRRVVYLAQRDDPKLADSARKAAERLNLPLEIRRVGHGALESRLVQLVCP
jgi:hypothetical protein